jgi:hypothetical protein
VASFIEEAAGTLVTKAPPKSGVYGEFKLTDAEGNQLDVSEEGWPV